MNGEQEQLSNIHGKTGGGENIPEALLRTLRAIGYGIVEVPNRELWALVD